MLKMDLNISMNSAHFEYVATCCRGGGRGRGAASAIYGRLRRTIFPPRFLFPSRRFASAWVSLRRRRSVPIGRSAALASPLAPHGPSMSPSTILLIDWLWNGIGFWNLEFEIWNRKMGLKLIFLDDFDWKWRGGGCSGGGGGGGGHIGLVRFDCAEIVIDSISNWELQGDASWLSCPFIYCVCVCFSLCWAGFCVRGRLLRH